MRVSLFSVDIEKFMRPVAYTHMREMCLSRVFVHAFFGREIICFFLRNRRLVLYCAHACLLFVIIIVGRYNVGRQ